jgi:hypothetical protein
MTPQEALAALDGVIRETLPEDRPGLVVALSARLAALGAHLAAGPASTADRDSKAALEPPGRLLAAPEAAALAGVTVRWLLRHTRGLRFRQDLSRKQARFDEQGFRRWLQTRN